LGYSFLNTLYIISKTRHIFQNASPHDPNVRVVHTSQVRGSSMLLLLTVGN